MAPNAAANQSGSLPPDILLVSWVVKPAIHQGTSESERT
jgi:hypothetical protein